MGTRLSAPLRALKYYTPSNSWKSPWRRRMSCKCPCCRCPSLKSSSLAQRHSHQPFSGDVLMGHYQAHRAGWCAEYWEMNIQTGLGRRDGHKGAGENQQLHICSETSVTTLREYDNVRLLASLMEVCRNSRCGGQRPVSSLTKALKFSKPPALNQNDIFQL